MVGATEDNAAMERLFGLLQNTVFNWCRCATRDELRIPVVAWIEQTYHRGAETETAQTVDPIQ
ncbi:hypothetical protein JDV76_01890 [Corynebacterium sp. CCM 8864]|uniref:Integrase catalytic domain-containing protein n=2 Tax=Corynebacterium marambiense TaxID=2765364 RepID=A0ABS0VSH1_9CORY|nr:hypothetical protein [Corynebacterium marambiense]